MSGYKNFAIVGAGTIGNFIIHQFLKDKAAGTVNEVVVLTRQVNLDLDHILRTLTTGNYDRSRARPSTATPR
jgi:pyrroline-5-carboxylate reductase